MNISKIKTRFNWMWALLVFYFLVIYLAFGKLSAADPATMAKAATNNGTYSGGDANYTTVNTIAVQDGSDGSDGSNQY